MPVAKIHRIKDRPKCSLCGVMIITLFFGEQFKVAGIPIYCYVLVLCVFDLLWQNEFVIYVGHSTFSSLILFSIAWVSISTVVLPFSFEYGNISSFFSTVVTGMIISVVYFYARDMKSLYTLLKYVLFGILITLIVSTYELNSGWHLVRLTDYYLRMGRYNAFGFQVNFNDNASLLCISIFALLILMKTNKILPSCLILWILIVVYKIYARMAFVALMCVAIEAILLHFLCKKAFEIGAKDRILITFLILISCLALLPFSTTDRFLSIVSDSNNYIYDLNRIMLIKKGLMTITPLTLLFGNGCGITATIVGCNLHCVFLELLCDNGIFVFLWFMVLLYRMQFAFTQKLTTNAKILVSCFATAFLLLGFCSSSMLRIRPIWMMFAIFWRYYQINELNASNHLADREGMIMQKRENHSQSPASDFILKVAGFSLPSFLGAILTFIASAINTRIFDTATTGKINVYFTVLNFLVFLAYLGLDQAYCRYFNDCKSEAEKKLLYDLCIMLSLAVCIVICIIVYLFRSEVSLYIVGAPSMQVAISLIISLFIQTIWRYFCLMQRMSNKLLSYTILMTINTLTNKFSYTLISSVSQSAESSILAIAISSAFATIAFAFFDCSCLPSIKQLFASHEELTKKILLFGLPLMPITVLSWCNSSIPILLIGRMLSYEDAGVFSLAVTLSSSINIIQSGFVTFWVPYYYANYKSGNSRIIRIHDTVCIGMCTCGIILILVKNILFFILGETYRAGSNVFPLLIISPICYTIAETTGIGINISEKSYLHSIHYILSVMVNVCTCYFFLPLYGIIGAGIAVAASSIIMLVIKSVIGEYFYKCIGNRLKTTLSVSSLVLVAALDVCLKCKGAIRDVIILAILLILLLFYRNEVKYLLVVLTGLVKQFCKRLKVQE